MAEIIIKKRVDLGFLGNEYESSYLVFKSIAVRDYPKVMSDLEKIDKNNEATLEDKLNGMLKVLEDHFVEGLFDGQKVDKSDIGQFNPEVIRSSFEKLTGQDITSEVPIDPKEKSQSSTSSTTKVDNP